MYGVYFILMPEKEYQGCWPRTLLAKVFVCKQVTPSRWRWQVCHLQARFLNLFTHCLNSTWWAAPKEPVEASLRFPCTVHGVSGVASWLPCSHVWRPLLGQKDMPCKCLGTRQPDAKHTWSEQRQKPPRWDYIRDLFFAEESSRQADAAAMRKQDLHWVILCA